MTDISVLQPPLAFIIVLAAAVLFSLGLSRFSRGMPRTSSRIPYSCGENMENHLIQPDYGQFLPFAFFFTILHVMALMVATIPVTTVASSAIAAVYLGCALFGLYVLYSR